jgi:hypothetical protein
MNTLIQLDDEGYFVGYTEGDESPLEVGVILYPANTIDPAPLPTLSQGERAKWVSNEWVVIPVEEELIEVLTDEEQAAIDQEEINNASKALLHSTDWYVIRRSDTGVPIPEDIDTARAAARLSIVEEV